MHLRVYMFRVHFSMCLIPYNGPNSPLRSTLDLQSMEYVIDPWVNSGFHAKLLIHPVLWSSRKRGSDGNDQKWAWCAVGTLTFPPAKLIDLVLTARSGEADAKWALTEMQAREPDARASPLDGLWRAAPSGHWFPRSRAPYSASPCPKCLSQPSQAHFMHLSVGLNHRDDVFLPALFSLLKIFLHLSSFLPKTWFSNSEVLIHAASMEYSSEPQLSPHNGFLHRRKC